MENSDFQVLLQAVIDARDVQEQLSRINDLSVHIQKLNLDQAAINGLREQLSQKGIDLNLALGNSSKIKQQAGQLGIEIGKSISQNVSHEGQIDKVIDSQVGHLMSQFGIAGKKGSKAFDQIKQALIGYKKELASDAMYSDKPLDIFDIGTSADIGRVTEALAGNMKVADETKNVYASLRKYIKDVNRSGQKIHLPQSIKDEYGDDFKTMRSSLGSAFITGKGTDFEVFVTELNSQLGNVIDMSHGAESAFGNLVDKLNSTKTGNYLSARELFDNGYLDKNETEAMIQSAIDNIIAEEKKLEQVSSTAADAVVQNEAKKRQAVQETEKQYTKIPKNQSFARNDANFIQVFETSSNAAKKAQEHFKELLADEKAVVTVAENFDGSNALQSFTVNIKRANGEIESLRYAMQGLDGEKHFEYQGSTVNDASAVKQFQQLEKHITEYTNKLDALKTKYSNADVDYSGFEKSFEAFKNGEITINELSRAYNNLKTATEKGVQNLKSQAASFDPVQQAMNNMRDLPSMLKSLEADMGKLKDKSSISGISIQNLTSDYQALQNEMDKSNGRIPLTESWTSGLRNLMSSVTSTTEQVKALKKAEASDNSQIQKQAGYYSSILSNYRQIYALKQKLLNAGREESNAIKEQLRSLDANNKSIYKQIASENLKSREWENQARALKNSLSQSLKVTEACKEDQRVSQQELLRQKEINSILAKQQSAYKEICNTNKEISLADPAKNQNQVNALKEKKKHYQDIYLAAQKELQAYSNISISQEHLNSLSEIRKKSEIETSIAVAKQLGDKVSKIQLQVDTGAYESKVKTLVSQTMQWTDGNGNARISTDALTQSLQKLYSASDALSKNNSVENQKALVNAEKELDTQIKTVTSSIRSMNAEFAKDSAISSLHSQIQKFYDNNSAAHRKWGSQLKQMLAETSSGAGLTTQRVNEIKAAFNNVTTAARQAGKTGKSWFESFKDATKFLTYWTSSVFITMKAVSEVKEAINTIKGLDTALVDLKKTTTMTQGQLEDFYYDASGVAKEMGVSTQQIIEQASSWSRLGYSSAEAATKMAEYSSMFATISPGMDLDSATDGLVSVMKAFKIGGNDVNEVVDGIMSKINIIGNTRALSNSDIVEFLRRSSSAMAEANNSLEDTIALGTAITEITRDAANAGQVLKTVSMRIRGYDEETEEYIGGVEQLAGEIASLTKTAATPGGISLFSDAAKTEYKSTRELFSEISKIYDDLSDKDQAQLLEALAGKRNGQAVAAILNNYEAVEDSLASMANSAGNAEAEMNTAMDSIEFKLNRLKETGTGIAQNLFGREDIKTAIDGFTKLAEAVELITSKLGMSGTLGLGAGLFAGIKNVGRDKMLSLSFNCFICRQHSF